MQSSDYSFDIFDTALTRIWARPTDLFWELGSRLHQEQLISLSCDAWMQMRDDAERVARKATATGEIDLKHIYRQLAQQFGWSEAQMQTAMHHEVQLELASLRPVSLTQQRIAELRAAQHAITYLSDMYLPHEVILEALQQNGLWAEGDRLYVSGSVGVNKASGQLFQRYLAERSLRPEQLLHTGDSIKADVNSPQRLGIATQHFTTSHLTPDEQQIVDSPTLPLRFRSLLAGTSRLCRLQNPETDSHRQAIWNTAASVVGPVMFGFVHWCLLEAKRRGIQRLYFAARDGQILYKIAQIICKNWNYDIDCRYLYISRQALHIPSIQEIGEAERSWLFARFQTHSVRALCKRINLKPEQIEPYLTAHGLPSGRWEQNLTVAQQKSLEQVFQVPEVLDLITTMASDYREKAIAYFKQEGLGDGVPFATVDTGWTGGSQRSFSKLLAMAGLRPESGVQGFYFGLTKNVKAFESDRLIPYFLAPDDLNRRLFLCHHEILELFLSADHGSTVRYDLDAETNCYKPILRAEKNTTLLDWGLEAQHASILNFAEQATAILNSEDCRTDYFHQVAESLLTRFIFSPSLAEAHTFGTMVFAQDQAETELLELAPVYTVVDALTNLVNNRHIHTFAWLPGSVQRSSALARPLLRYVNAVREGHNYNYLAWRTLGMKSNREVKSYLQDALQRNPLLVFDRRFGHVTVATITQKLLGPAKFKRLRAAKRTLLKQEVAG
jgi:predicted HAD superfamily hydrolase